MSNTVCLHSIAAALNEGQKHYGVPGATWLDLNLDQRKFLSEYYPVCLESLPLFPEIESKASKDVSEINAFLTSRGFSIQLEPFFDPTSIALASILDVLALWAEKGKRARIKRNESEVFDAVSLNEHVSFFQVENYSFSIARIACKNQDDSVYMALADKPLDGFDLIDKVRSLSGNKVKSSSVPEALAGPVSQFGPKKAYGWLVFPMISLDQKIDIGWLKDLTCPGLEENMPVIVQQALQQNKLRANEEGVRMQSATAMTMVLGATIEPSLVGYIIDQPFYFWAERKGCSLPYFAAYITEDDWKDPKNI